MTTDAQQRVVLTAHPLQRVGAFALSRLAGATHPDEVQPQGFEAAVAELTEHAVRAGLVRDTKAVDGFWLKCSLSLFPNSPMSHPSNGKKTDQAVREAVERWRRMPQQHDWPPASCVLCGRSAVRFFGKVDVPLAESDIYRNTTPRGHAGMALCWPCACSFYALPYGCQLTGGPAIALHSWDEQFLQATVFTQVAHNRQVIAVGSAESRQTTASEVVALRALRQYEHDLRAGVDLLVFNNNNRGQTLEIYTMEQPLAEWLRRTARSPRRRRAFATLLRAHTTDDQPGEVGLARNGFRNPTRIVTTCARYLVTVAAGDDATAAAADLAALCFSYVLEVMGMDQQDLAEIKSTAGRVAQLLGEATSGGKLNEFYANFKEPKRLRSWLQRRAVSWLLAPGHADSGPLLTTRGFGLLFDPAMDGQAWFNRQMFLVAVLEELHQRGWRPDDGAQLAQEILEEADDLQHGDSNGEEDA